MKLPLLPLDKANHVAYGNLASLVGFGAALLLGLPPALGSGGATLLVAAGKELLDWWTGQGTPELADFVATLAGGTPGTVIAWSMAA